MKYALSVEQAAYSTFSSLCDLKLKPPMNNNVSVIVEFFTIKKANHTVLHQIKVSPSDEIPSQVVNPMANKLILLLVNPASGANKAPKMATKFAAWLHTFQCQYELIETIDASTVTTIDYSKYAVMVCISGDGLIHHYVQHAVAHHIQIPVVVVAGGTGNALATAIDSIDPQMSFLALLHQRAISLPLMKVQQDNNIYYSFIGLYWGLVADVDLGTDRFRACLLYTSPSPRD